MIISKGSPKGPFDRIVAAIPGRHTNEKHEIVLGEGPEKNFLEKILGITWVGFFRALYDRPLKYQAWELLPVTGTWGITEKIRQGPYYFYQHTMALRIATLAVGNYEAPVTIVFGIEIKNPVQAMVVVGAWEKRLSAAVAQVCREFISVRTVDQLRKERDTGGGSDLVDLIKGLQLNDAVSEDNLGLQIVDARIEDIDLDSGNVEHTKALQAIEIARLNKEASKEEAKRERILGGGEAARIKKRVEAYGRDGDGVRHHVADAIANTELDALSIGNGGHLVVGADVSKNNPPPTTPPSP